MLSVLRNRSVQVGLTVAILIAGAEAAVRVRAYFLHGTVGATEEGLYQPDPVLGKVLRPGAKVEGTRGRLSVNSLGFRGPEITVEKPPGTVRVLCLGDSVVFGRYALSDETVWTAQLGRRLSEMLGRPVETVNAGVPGYSVGTTMKAFELHGLRLSPDAVVICQVVNDLNDACDRCFGPPRDPHSSGDPPTLTIEQRLLKARDENFLSYHLLRKNITPLVTPLGHDTRRRDDVPADIAEPYAQQLSALVRLARSHGVQVVLCTAWKAFSPEQPPAAQESAASSLLLVNPYLTVGGLYRAFDAFNDAVRAVAREENVPLVDLAQQIPADASLFGDAVHFNDKGDTVMAKALAAPVADVLRTKEPHAVQ